MWLAGSVKHEKPDSLALVGIMLSRLRNPPEAAVSVGKSGPLPGSGGFLLAPLLCRALDIQVNALLVASPIGGPTHWVTRQSFLIENMLEFNGIPYDYFDIGDSNLTQAILDQYEGVILEGCALRWCATEEERLLIAGNMETGNITALVSIIKGNYTDLNTTIYSAIDVQVDGWGMRSLTSISRKAQSEHTIMRAAMASSSSEDTRAST